MWGMCLGGMSFTNWCKLYGVLLSRLTEEEAQAIATLPLGEHTVFLCPFNPESIDLAMVRPKYGSGHEGLEVPTHMLVGTFPLT